MCLVLMPFYPSWDMLTRTRDREAYGAEFVHIQGAYGWIVAHTDPGDVFLCDQVLACQVVSPAGRKLVSIMSIFANPYESDALRPVTRDEMLNAIKTNDESKFHLLMERFHPKYVLVRDEDVAACDQRPYLRSLFRSGNIGIYEILSKRV